MKSHRIRRGTVLAAAACAVLLGAAMPTLTRASAATTSSDDPGLAPCADFTPTDGWDYGNATSGPNAADVYINLAGPVDQGCKGGSYAVYLYDQTTKCVGGTNLPGVNPCAGGTSQTTTTALTGSPIVYAAKSVRGQSELTYSYTFSGPPPGSTPPTWPVLSEHLCVGAVTWSGAPSTSTELDGAPGLGTGTPATDWTPASATGSNQCQVLGYGTSSGGGGNQFY